MAAEGEEMIIERKDIEDYIANADAREVAEIIVDSMKTWLGVIAICNAIIAALPLGERGDITIPEEP